MNERLNDQNKECRMKGLVKIPLGVSKGEKHFFELYRDVQNESR